MGDGEACQLVWGRCCRVSSLYVKPRCAVHACLVVSVCVVLEDFNTFFPGSRYPAPRVLSFSAPKKGSSPISVHSQHVVQGLGSVSSFSSGPSWAAGLQLNKVAGCWHTLEILQPRIPQTEGTRQSHKPAPED